MMKRRGKVLRDASTGAGLLIVDGQQYPFSLRELWKSEVPPRSGVVVEVEFEQYGKIHAIYAIAESQLAREQSGAALAGAKRTGSPLTAKIGTRFPIAGLVAAGLLIISWLFLAAVSVQTPLGRLDFTFWQILGFLNSRRSFEAMMQGRDQSGAGFYGFFALVAIAGPFLRYFWKDRRAAWGGLLPLLFMAMVGLMIRGDLKSSLRGETSGALDAVMKQMRDEAMAAVSLGFGVYLSGLASLYFAGIAARELLSAKATEKRNKESAHRAAA
jgi:hypothetical protein